MSTINRLAREKAFKEGKKRYYTGVPCKEGHIADRYVSNGGCVACVAKFQPQRNAFDKNAEPLDGRGVWIRNDYTDEEREGLKRYLQECANVYDRSVRPGHPPLVLSAPPSAVDLRKAPPGAAELPALESLPSAEYDPEATEKCEHGIDLGFCSICDE